MLLQNVYEFFFYGTQKNIFFKNVQTVSFCIMKVNGVQKNTGSHWQDLEQQDKMIFIFG